jgi:hypothetical protein
MSGGGYAAMGLLRSELGWLEALLSVVVAAVFLSACSGAAPGESQSAEQQLSRQDFDAAACVHERNLLPHRWIYQTAFPAELGLPRAGFVGHWLQLAPNSSAISSGDQQIFVELASCQLSASGVSTPCQKIHRARELIQSGFYRAIGEERIGGMQAYRYGSQQLERIYVDDHGAATAECVRSLQNESDWRCRAWVTAGRQDFGILVRTSREWLANVETIAAPFLSDAIAECF